MFGLFRRTPRRVRLAGARPHLERLEARDCPAAPVLETFWATQIGSSLLLQGSVTDENVAAVDVVFGGQVSGQAAPDTSGAFYLIVPYDDQNVVTAQAFDAESMTSSLFSTSVSHPEDADPFLTLSIVNVSGTDVRVTGRVLDEHPEGLVVYLGGVVGGTATANAQGLFEVTLAASAVGAIQASVWDAAGNESNLAVAMLANQAPAIQNFGVSEETGGWFVFTGRVVDEDAAGLTVSFGGVPVSLTGKTATVLADGTFRLRIQLNGTSTDEGIATAVVTDAFGQQSAAALVLVHQTGV